MDTLPKELHHQIAGTNITLMLKLSCVNRYFRRLFVDKLAGWWQKYQHCDLRIKAYLTPSELQRIHHRVQQLDSMEDLPRLTTAIVEFARDHPRPHRFRLMIRNLYSVLELRFQAANATLWIILTGGCFPKSYQASLNRDLAMRS